MIWGAISKMENQNYIFLNMMKVEIIKYISMQKALFPDCYFVYYQDNAYPQKNKAMDGIKITIFSCHIM